MLTERVSDPRMIVRGVAIALGCTCWLLASFAAGQEAERPRRKAPPVPAAALAGAKQEQETHVQLYRVKNVQAGRILEVVSTVYSGYPIALAADKRTNSIIVSASPEMQEQISALIAQLDSTAERGTERQLKVFRLKYAEPQETAAVISRIFSKDDARIAVDARTNSILVEGSPDTLGRIEGIVSTLDTAADREAKGEGAGTTLQVRVVWLASELPPDGGAKPADDLKEVVAELAKVGVKEVRQLGQAIVNTAPDGAFHVRCSPLLAGRPTDLEVSGTIKMRQEMPILNVQVSASQTEPTAEAAPGRRGPATKRLVDLGTTITAPLGHYVVLGVTPVEKMNSVLIVQVTAGKR